MPHPEQGPRRGAVPALEVVVHHVVVEQREVVDQFDRDGARDGHLARGPDGLGGQQGKGGTNRLPTISTRGAPVGVEEPEVVADHSPDLGCQPVQRIPESRPDHATGPAQGRRDGPRCAAHAGTASGTVRACPNRARAWVAAATPERTAPSMVAGQPVSVHAPARYRPGIPVTGPGRRARVPGV